MSIFSFQRTNLNFSSFFFGSLRLFLLSPLSPFFTHFTLSLFSSFKVKVSRFLNCCFICLWYCVLSSLSQFSGKSISASPSFSAMDSSTKLDMIVSCFSVSTSIFASSFITSSSLFGTPNSVNFATDPSSPISRTWKSDQRCLMIPLIRYI